MRIEALEIEAMNRIKEKISTHGVKVRKASTSDLSSLTKLLGQLFSIETDFSPNIRKQRQGLATLMQTEGTTVLVAVYKDETIGMCTLQPLISTAEGGVVGIVEALVIAEEWRYKGVGSMLLSEIEAEATAQHMTRLQLLTDKNNETALQFYKRHQWTQTNMVAIRKKF